MIMLTLSTGYKDNINFLESHLCHIIYIKFIINNKNTTAKSYKPEIKELIHVTLISLYPALRLLLRAHGDNLQTKQNYIST